MNAATPLVSVIIPTFNRRELVQKTIESVLSQTYPACEVIVIDDGSTDGTERALATRFGSQIRYSWQENRGESVARNAGIIVARGEYIALLDSDDLWLPNKLSKQVQLIESLPHICMVGCQAWLMDSHGKRIEVDPIGAELQRADYSLESLLWSNEVGGGSIGLIRRSALEQIGGFDPDIRFGEDWDLWLRLRARWDFAFVPEPLACIRRHINTQCHLPRSETIEHVLGDHLHLLDKAFTALSPENSLTDLRNRSFARQYAEAAFASYAWGRYAQGREWLAEAIALDPAQWQNLDMLVQTLVNYGAAVAEIEGGYRIDRIESYTHGVQTHWPLPCPTDARLIKQAKAQLYAEGGYRGYLAKDWRTARRFMWRALRTDGSLWRDRGLLRRFSYALTHG